MFKLRPGDGNRQTDRCVERTARKYDNKSGRGNDSTEYGHKRTYRIAFPRRSSSVKLRLMAKLLDNATAAALLKLVWERSNWVRDIVLAMYSPM